MEERKDSGGFYTITLWFESEETALNCAVTEASMVASAISHIFGYYRGIPIKWEIQGSRGDKLGWGETHCLKRKTITETVS